MARARSTTDMLSIEPELLEELVESDWTDCSGHMPRQLAPAPHTVMPHRQQTAPAPAEPLREQDRLCPLANVARIMATELPEDAKIARSAKVMMQEIVTEFLCFITSEANDISLTKGHKAVTQDDVVQAFENLGEAPPPPPPPPPSTPRLHSWLEPVTSTWLRLRDRSWCLLSSARHRCPFLCQARAGDLMQR